MARHVGLPHAGRFDELIHRPGAVPQFLQEAQARGVAVRVLVDAVGARYSRPSIITRLHAEGVPAAVFLPTRVPWRFPYANLRNHRKLLVVDGRVGFTGGMNIREGHQPSLAPASPVRCLHFRLEGPVVRDMQQVFADDWFFATGEVLPDDDTWYAPGESCGPVAACGVSDGPDSEMGTMPTVLFGALAAATSDGEKKNTRLSLKAFSSSVVHTPSAATPPAISAMRL
jgi:cardiolipin synthase